MEEGFVNKRIEEKEEKSIQRTLFSAIIFRLEENLYAINIENLREIIFFRTIYRVPRTNETLLGVINLRGNIIPVFSLNLLLGHQESLKGKNKIFEDERFIMILREDKNMFGLVVDTIYKNISVLEGQYKTKEYIKKWLKDDLFDGLILFEGHEIFTLSINGLLNYIFSLK
ncbi:MAG: chemotaxis protein CheW [Brevinematia bacterium]